MSLPSSELIRGRRVRLNTPGYMGKLATLDYPTVSDKDGTPRWQVVLVGSHSRIAFRVDEMDPAPAALGPL